jgi:acyl-CoA synthetase (AMP-forming)/AMP-acid ligase II
VNVVDAMFERNDATAVAVVRGGRGWSYGELRCWVEQVAEWMEDAGQVRPQQRIGLLCVEPLAHMVLSLAILKAGACVVPVAPELAERERLALADITGLHALVMEGRENWCEPVDAGVEWQADGWRARLVRRLGVKQLSFTEADLRGWIQPLCGSVRARQGPARAWCCLMEPWWRVSLRRMQDWESVLGIG